MARVKVEAKAEKGKAGWAVRVREAAMEGKVSAGWVGQGREEGEREVWGEEVRVWAMEVLGTVGQAVPVKTEVTVVVRKGGWVEAGSLEEREGQGRAGWAARLRVGAKAEQGKAGWAVRARRAATEEMVTVGWVGLMREEGEKEG